MGARYTPGRLFYSSVLPRFHGDEVEAYAYYCVVWQATDDPENPALFCETPNRVTMAEAYADAFLITAAPDLLEAMKGLEPHLDAIVCYASTQGEHEPNRLAVDARAAISRALPGGGGEVSDTLHMTPRNSRECTACAGTGDRSPWEHDHYVFVRGECIAVCGACGGAGFVTRWGFRWSAAKYAAAMRHSAAILRGEA
jgi:hypothetical protein